MKRHQAALGMLAAVTAAAALALVPATAQAAPLIDTGKQTFVEVTDSALRDLIGAGECTTVYRIPVKDWYVTGDAAKAGCADDGRNILGIYRVVKGKATSVAGTRPFFFNSNCTEGMKGVPYPVMRAIWDQYADQYGYTCGALKRTSPSSSTQKAIGKLAVKGFDARCITVMPSASTPSWAMVSFVSDWSRQHVGEGKCPDADIPYTQIVKKSGAKWQLLNTRIFGGLASDEEIAQELLSTGMPNLAAADFFAYSTGKWTPPWR